MAEELTLNQVNSTIADMLKELNETGNLPAGTEAIVKVLSMPDDQFELVAPLVINEYEKSVNQPNENLKMAMSLNAQGLTIDDAKEAFVQSYEQLSTVKDSLKLTDKKMDFLRTLMNISINALMSVKGVPGRLVNIAIEKCHPDAKVPTYAHLTDAGLDVYAIEDVTIAPGETKLIPTGIKVAIPQGYELQVRPKSGRCLKTKLRIANTPGTIDAGYRDEIGVIIDNIEPPIKELIYDTENPQQITGIKYGASYTIGKGEKFAQLVLTAIPRAVFYDVESVATIANDGRDGGFGSSGLK